MVGIFKLLHWATNNYMMYLAYSSLALLIMLPLLPPGFILALDMAFVPRPPLPDEVTSSYLFHAMLHFLSYVIPADILQKIILFGILLFSGVGMHRLVESLKVYKVEGEEKSRMRFSTFDLRLSTNQWAAYVAGIFYMINPFVYGRFMTGQYAVLLGYALLPFFVRAVLRFFESPSLKRVLPAAGLVLAISIVSIHTVGLTVLLGVTALAIAVWQHRREREHLLAVAKHGAAGVGLTVLLSAYWLVPLLSGQGKTAEQISDFGTTDQAAFATDGGLLNVLQLQGFWAEAQGLFTLPGEPLPLSGVWYLCLWLVVLIGFVYAWQRQRDIAILFGITGIAAAVLATGGPINQWFTEHVPLFAGYREPHKFAALLALAYAVFAAYGGASLFSRVRPWKRMKYVVVGFLLALPFLITPAMVWGFNGQLQPVQYPADWYTINRRFSEQPPEGKVLFLPWHLYMEFSFSDRIIATPANKFFNAEVITSNDPEFANISQLDDEITTKLDKEILPRAANTTNLGAALRPLDIEYVLLAKETDYEKYGYLEAQTDIQLVTETATLKLYRNMTFERTNRANH